VASNTRVELFGTRMGNVFAVAMAQFYVGVRSNVSARTEASFQS
jgi:hypothetical protein